ncbi:MAG: hypothetical protein M1839_005690 [Geoglossum umbratile]|nr:MAG: hypothetical protein M1839_005690 [Geoglossum umbratile]
MNYLMGLIEREKATRQSQREREKPWKHVGYKVFSRWIASDQTFLIVRKFGALNARVALSLQDEIAELEEKLDTMDQVYSSTNVDVNNGSFREDPFTEPDDRQELVRKILPGKLAKYYKYLNGYAQLASRGPLHPDDVGAVRRWLEHIRPGAIDERECEYIQRFDDLIPVHPKTRSWFGNVLEQSRFLNVAGLRRCFTRAPREDHVSLKNEGTIYLHNNRVERLASGVISLAGLVMLIAPLWILAYVRPLPIRLGIISGFIVLFFVMVAVATTARMFEALAAAAAYSAVLMVFLQFGTR